MTPVLRNPVAVFAVTAVAVGTVGVFTFAKPTYRPRYETKMLDFSKRDYYRPEAVKRSFAAHGIRLRYQTDASGLLLLSNAPPPWDADALQVAIAPRTGQGSWGPKLEAYDERFGNILVTYGGRDETVVRRIEAAVSDLR